MRRTITLTTDFGLVDPYVGLMKGVILGLNPEVNIVDLCHEVAPQNIVQAAFLLKSSRHFFPSGTIHVVVVDPGVGTRRRAVALKTGDAFFVAPDNGVLSGVLEDPEAFEAVALTNPRYWHHPISSTFHGRDIFAPVAAHLSLGVSLYEFGEPVSNLITLPFPQPLEKEEEIIGQVVHIDRFGNLITNIEGSRLPREDFQIEVGGHCISGLSPSYAEGSELLALIGSSGNLEIAVKNGSAAERLNLGAGDKIKVKKRVRA